MAWVYLFIAGLLETTWAVGLKYTEGFTRLGPSIFTLTAMTFSVWLLAQAVRTLPLGTAYAVWTGIGAVGAALVGMAVFGEPRTAARLLCLALILIGIAGLRVVSGEQ